MNDPNAKIVDRRADTPTRRRVDEIFEAFAAFTKRAMLGFAIIGLTSAGSLGGFAYVLHQRNNEQNNLKAQAKTLHGLVLSNIKLAKQNRQFALDQQLQRRDSAYNSCVLRNKQNRGVRHVLIGFHITKFNSYFPILSDCQAYAEKVAP